MVPVVLDLYRGHRFRAEVISQVGSLLFRFAVSYREGAEMMARRGVHLTRKQSGKGWDRRINSSG